MGRQSGARPGSPPGSLDALSGHLLRRSPQIPLPCSARRIQWIPLSRMELRHALRYCECSIGSSACIPSREPPPNSCLRRFEIEDARNPGMDAALRLRLSDSARRLEDRTELSWQRRSALSVCSFMKVISSYPFLRAKLSGVHITQDRPRRSWSDANFRSNDLLAIVHAYS